MACECNLQGEDFDGLFYVGADGGTDVLTPGHDPEFFPSIVQIDSDTEQRIARDNVTFHSLGSDIDLLVAHSAASVDLTIFQVNYGEFLVRWDTWRTADPSSEWAFNAHNVLSDFEHEYEVKRAQLKALGGTPSAPDLPGAHKNILETAADLAPWLVAGALLWFAAPVLVPMLKR